MSGHTKILGKTVCALIEYAGPLDDPRIGWIGTNPSHHDLFKCERCGMEHLDSSKIQHKEGCAANALLNALATMKKEILPEGDQ